MKKIFDFIAAAALSLLLAGCSVFSEDAFSTEPVAPEFYSHADILMTSNTMDENVAFSWSAYRFLPEGLSYVLTMSYEGVDAKVVETKELFWSCTKTEFRSLLYKSFPNLPQNATFPLSLTVKVNDGTKDYAAQPLSIKVYAYGDMIAPEITLAGKEAVLDPASSTSTMVLITWTDARLVYGEEVKYDVYLCTNQATTKAGDSVDYELATGLTVNEYSTTVDALNDAVVAAGGVENEANAVTFKVRAYCDSFSEGVVATSAETMSVTTYTTTFPEVLYLPGSHQGWSPATAPTLNLSSSIKGYYGGVVDLTTADGSDCEFKFCIKPDWGDDYGGTIEMGQYGSTETYHAGTGKVGVSDNIKVPSGVYAIALNKKLGTLTMVELKSLCMIGAACGDYSWGQDVVMEWNHDTNVFTATTTLKPGEYKFRFNGDWSYSIGNTADGLLIGGENITNEKDEGEYKVSIDLSTVPYKVSILSTSFPEAVYVPGAMNGWGFDHQSIAGNGEGLYQAFRWMGGDYGFKITEEQGWDKQWGSDGTEPVVNDDGSKTYSLVYSTGGNIMEGADNAGYFRVDFDYTSSKVTLTPITTIGMIGAFPGNSWSSDYASMTYDKDKDMWIAEDVEIRSGCEWKFRMNEAWTINLGGDIDNLVQDGANIVESKGGIYDVELHVNTTPYKAVLTWKAEPGAAVYKKQVTLAGDYQGAAWSPENDPKLPGADGFYSGAMTMYGATYGFKVVHDGNWISGQLTEGTTYDFVLGAGDNMMLPDGSYFWSIDIASENKTAKAVPITKVGLIGSFNGWADDLEMTFDPDTHTYKGKVTLAANDEVKIRFNGNWDYNLGMNDSNQLVAGGANIVVAAAGEYDVEIGLTGASSFIAFIDNSVKPSWGVIGNFNGWGGDAVMTEVIPGIWVSEKLDLTEGWKIRYNGSWDVNRGAATPTVAGEFVPAYQGGSDINLAGSYKVVYNENSGTIGTLGWGITGSIANANINWDKDIPMNLGSDGKWYSYPVFFSASDQFKIRQYGEWNADFGGTCTAVGEPFAAAAGGSNISVPAEGTYMLVFDPTAGTLTLSTDFWGVIGEFNGWGGDEFMMPAGDGKWYAFGKNYGGGWKIRQGAGWDNNRGGVYVDANPFPVTNNGDNITVTGVSDFAVVYDSAAETITVGVSSLEKFW